MRQITPQQLKAWLDDRSRPAPSMVDVRETWEWDICALPGAVHIPMNSIPSRQTELDPDRETVLICHHGGRSMQVAAYLERNGFESVYNLSGGVNAWAREVDAAMPTY